MNLLDKLWRLLLRFAALLVSLYLRQGKLKLFSRIFFELNTNFTFLIISIVGGALQLGCTLLKLKDTEDDHVRKLENKATKLEAVKNQ